MYNSSIYLPWIRLTWAAIMADLDLIMSTSFKILWYCTLQNFSGSYSIISSISIKFSRFISDIMPWIWLLNRLYSKISLVKWKIVVWHISTQGATDCCSAQMIRYIPFQTLLSSANILLLNKPLSCCESCMKRRIIRFIPWQTILSIMKFKLRNFYFS